MADVADNGTGDLETDSYFVGYLHAGDNIAHSWHASMMRLFAYDLAHHARMIGEIGEQCGAARIIEGRNSIVTKFLATTAEWLMWIDTDMGFEPWAVDALIELADPTDRPIVGGLAFGQKKSGPLPAAAVELRAFPTIYAWVDSPDGPDQSGYAAWHDYPPNTLVRCDATGGAFLIVHRTVYQTLAELHDPPRIWYDDEIVDGRLFGEDLTFCRRAGAAGFAVHVHTGIKTSHLKQAYLSEETLAAAATLPDTNLTGVLRTG